MLRWAAHDQLEAACGTCLRPIKQGIHKRRPAVHTLMLADLPIMAVELTELADPPMELGRLVDSGEVFPVGAS